MRCARCNSKTCREGRDCSGGTATDDSPYRSGPDAEIHRIAGTLEVEGYGRLCRLEELISFSHRMGYRHLGLAFCVGLSEEARLLDELVSPSFELTSVCCKIGGLPKDSLGLPRLRREGQEATCNPVGQARVLNEAGTDLNIIMGLCLGHDILFQTHSDAPTTTILVKDRVLGHNPAAALYSRYLRRRVAAFESAD